MRRSDFYDCDVLVMHWWCIIESHVAKTCLFCMLLKALLDVDEAPSVKLFFALILW